MEEVYYTEVDTQNNETSLNLRDLLGLFVSRWYWFVISVAIMLLLATYYFMKTPPRYTRSAQMLIKDDGNGRANGLTAEFQSIGLLTNNTNINNEILTLKSPTLMTDVVRRLNLTDMYFVPDGLRQRELYKESPVQVVFSTQKGHANTSFDIKVLSDKEAELSNFKSKIYGESDGKLTVPMGKLTKTPVGYLTISATNNMNEDWYGEKISFVKTTLRAATGSYSAALGVRLSQKESTIIDLSISDPSIRKAEDILNELIAVYNENWIKDKNQIAVTTSEFIGERLGVIEGELGNVDNSISNYKSSNLLPDVGAVSQIYLKERAENKKEMQEISSEQSVAQYIRRALSRNDITKPLPANSGITNAGIQQQITEYNKLVQDRNRLVASSSESNPLVQDLEQQIRSLHNAVVQSVDNEIAALNLRMSNVRLSQAVTTGQLASNPRQAKQLLSVERQQKVKETLYIYLLQKREENELSQAFTAYNNRVITAPLGSMLPTSPRKGIILFIATLLGLLIPAVILFIRERMNTKVRGRKDIDKLSMPFVGELPETDGSKKPKENKGGHYVMSPVVVKDSGKDIANEAFRMVRTNLEFMLGVKENHKVVMLTSMNPGSGKTFVSINLAVCFAVKGKKTAVIDLDMRRASLSHYVGKPKEGISNYLGGLVDDWHSIMVCGTIQENLDVMPVGTIPPNPTELLFSKRFEDLIASMREEYDYIILDCPPTEVVADSSIITKHVDMTLFIIRAGLLERDMLPIVEEYYRDKKFTNLGLLLNGTDASTGYGKYKYGRYGYRYGYNYGYGSYESKS